MRKYPPGSILARGFDWETVRFPAVMVGEFATLRYGKGLVESQRIPGIVPVYGTNGQCGWHSESLCQGPGVILGRKGQGHLGVEWCDGPFWVIDTAYHAELDRRVVDPRWFYYVTKFVGLDHLKTGEKPGLPRELFCRQLFPFPSLEQQREISAVLGNIDERIRANERISHVLEEMAQALFKSWFIDFDPVVAKSEGRKPFGMSDEIAALFPDSFEDSQVGPTPRGWVPENLGEFVKINNRVRGRDYQHQVINYLDIASVKPGSVTGYTQIPLAEAPSRAQRLVQDHDIVWSCVRPNRRSFALIVRPEPNVVVSTGFAVLTPLDGNWPFVYSVIATEEFAEYLTTHAEGSAYPAVRPDTFAGYQLIRPHAAILEAFNAIAGPMFESIAHRQSENHLLAQMRDSLLEPLLSGEISLMTHPECLVEEATAA